MKSMKRDNEELEAGSIVETSKQAPAQHCPIAFMADSKPLVLITGVTGFLAQHVVAATLKEGYRVRGYVFKSLIFWE